MIRTLNIFVLNKLFNLNQLNNSQYCIINQRQFSSKSDDKKPPAKVADDKNPPAKAADDKNPTAKAADNKNPPPGNECVDNKSAENTVLVKKEGEITTICINRPKFKNAIDFVTSKLLVKAIADFEEDPAAKVAVLHGAGGVFCAGVDINEYTSQQIHPELLFLREGTVGPTRRHLLKPIVCAIEGMCAAEGVELAMLCDLRIMDACAQIGFLNRRFGIPLLDGGSARLQALVGLSHALDLILTGRLIEGKEALQMGLVNRLVPPGTAIGQAMNLALSIAKFPQKALLHDRNSVLYAAYDASSFDASIEQEVLKTNKLIIEEAQVGAKRFFDGFGRHGSSKNITERNLPDWELSEIEHEKNYKKLLELENEKNTKK